MGLPGRRPQAVAAATSPAYACLPVNLSQKNDARTWLFVILPYQELITKRKKVKALGNFFLIPEKRENAKEAFVERKVVRRPFLINKRSKIK